MEVIGDSKRSLNIPDTHMFIEYICIVCIIYVDLKNIYSMYTTYVYYCTRMVHIPMPVDNQVVLYRNR